MLFCRIQFMHFCAKQSYLVKLLNSEHGFCDFNPSIWLENTHKTLFTSLSTIHCTIGPSPHAILTLAGNDIIISRHTFARWQDLVVAQLITARALAFCHMTRFLSVWLQDPVKVISALIATCLDKSWNAAVYSEQRAPTVNRAVQSWKILAPLTESLSMAPLFSGFRWANLLTLSKYDFSTRCSYRTLHVILKSSLIMVGPLLLYRWPTRTHFT